MKDPREATALANLALTGDTAAKRLVQDTWIYWGAKPPKDAAYVAVTLGNPTYWVAVDLDPFAVQIAAHAGGDVEHVAKLGDRCLYRAWHDTQTPGKWVEIDPTAYAAMLVAPWITNTFVGAAAPRVIDAAGNIEGSNE